MAETSKTLVEQDLFLEQVMTFLERQGLCKPALMALEMSRPFAFLGGQLLWIAQPALSFMVPRNIIGQLAQLLEEPTAVDTLIAHLEIKER